MSKNFHDLDSAIDADLAALGTRLDMPLPTGVADRARLAARQALNETWLAEQAQPTPSQDAVAEVKTTVRAELAGTATSTDERYSTPRRSGHTVSGSVRASDRSAIRSIGSSGSGELGPHWQTWRWVGAAAAAMALAAGLLWWRGPASQDTPGGQPIPIVQQDHSTDPSPADQVFADAGTDLTALFLEAAERVWQDDGTVSELNEQMTSLEDSVAEVKIGLSTSSDLDEISESIDDLLEATDPAGGMSWMAHARQGATG